MDMHIYGRTFFMRLGYVSKEFESVRSKSGLLCVCVIEGRVPGEVKLAETALEMRSK